MNKSSIILIFCWFFFLKGEAQLHIIVDQIPENTPENASIYIAGNFQGWDPVSEDYKLQKSESVYSIDINPNPGNLEFKFTRGSWDTVEGNENGGFLPNRTYTYQGPPDTLNLQILSWEDVGGGNSTAAENVQIWDEDFYIPQLNRSRRIWVYLPPDYESSSKSYPVLYMHDGQNVFDDATSFIGEWHVDETLNLLFDQGDHGCIVVAIDNGGSERLNEYSPWVNPNYGGGQGHQYVEFIVNTLKPAIDAEFRTKPERDNTGIMGSSMGGLISLYAGVEFQNVFSKVGSFSPAYWFSEESYEHVRTTAHDQPTKIYTIVGQNESNQLVASVLQMKDVLELAGYGEDEHLQIVHADGQHSEWYWDREFGAAYLWLFGEEGTSPTEEIIENNIIISPNPTINYIRISGIKLNGKQKLIISNANGKTIIDQLLINKTIDLKSLSSGIYFITIEQENTLLYTGKIIKK
jgi:predicted alpha/beta superfamily hydrolase